MLERGHSGDGYDLASNSCNYDMSKGDLSGLSWARGKEVYFQSC